MAKRQDRGANCILRGPSGDPSDVLRAGEMFIAQLEMLGELEGPPVCRFFWGPDPVEPVQSSEDGLTHCFILPPEQAGPRRFRLEGQAHYKGEDEESAIVSEASATLLTHAGTPGATFDAQSGGGFGGIPIAPSLLAHRWLPRSSSRRVELTRPGSEWSPSAALGPLIRIGTRALSFDRYKKVMDAVLCGGCGPAPQEPNASKKARRNGRGEGNQPLGLSKTCELTETEFDCLKQRRFLPFNDTDAYRCLKAATEAFVQVNVRAWNDQDLFPLLVDESDIAQLAELMGITPDELLAASKDNPVAGLTASYLEGITDLEKDPNANREQGGTGCQSIPYLVILRDKFKELGIGDDLRALNDSSNQPNGRCVGGVCLSASCEELLRERLCSGLLIELIWSYWHEEAMLAQSMNAISRRFQNISRPDLPDPLANLEIDPLRPLNNLIWGYIQDEQHRLSVVRRAYEYDHHYGLRLQGKAVPELRPADSRSKFLEAFHTLLQLTSAFYRQDDDTTVISDAFPVLNGLKEVHLILSQGAHNQFGDLPSTARQEMLIQQWLLSRPEFREYLPTRVMVAYPEPWMDRVDAMKSLQGWTDTSVIHFNKLATFGEQVLLSIRFENWNSIIDPQEAKNWARFWRAEIQGYIHAYRAVTGIDLATTSVGMREMEQRDLLPSFHIRRQMRRQQAPAPGVFAPAAPQRGFSPDGVKPVQQRVPEPATRRS